MATISVGCIGLGPFGARIATRLAQEGFPLMIFDASSDPIRYFILKTSADIADSPRMMAEMCDVVIAVLPSAAEVRDIAFGRAGLAGASRGCLLIDMGTSGAAESKALAEELRPRGITLIEAPACGTPLDAKAGKLIVPVGGDPAAIERCMPVLRALGEKVLRTGPVGSANAVAALADYLRAASLLAAGEAVLIARRSDIAPPALIEMCHAFGVLGPAIGETLARSIAAGADSGRTLDDVVKHLDIARALAEAAGLAPRFSALCRELWTAAWRERGSEADHAAILRWLETATAKPPENAARPQGVKET